MAAGTLQKETDQKSNPTRQQAKKKSPRKNSFLLVLASVPWW